MPRPLLLALFAPLLLVPIPHDAGAHENLNSGDESVGSYEVQVATDPEIPPAGQPFRLDFRVLNHQSASNILNSLDTRASEVSHFRMGARLYYNDQLVGVIPVQDHAGGEWSTTYTFGESGNHIMYVDLYDAGPGGGPATFDFNISVLSVFGPAFVYVISAGSIACFVLLGWIAVSRKMRDRSQPRT
ncbi:MAG: hypothetical protein KGI33_12085 [Thaumarchaeota archaeon]|nr:hypothetical protein [Nitrososphaerota archaeon]